MRSRFSKSGVNGASFFAFQDIITGTAGFLIVIAVFLALGLDQVVAVSEDTDSDRFKEEDLTPLLEEIARLKKEAASQQRLPSEDEATLRRMVEGLKDSIAQLMIDESIAGKRSVVVSLSVLDREAMIEKQKHLTQLEALEKARLEKQAQLQDSVQKLLALERLAKDAENLLQQSRDQQNVLRLIPERSDTSKEPVLVLVRDNSFIIQPFDGSEGWIASSTAALMKRLEQVPPSGHYVVFYFKPSGAHHFETLTKRVRSAGFEIGYDLIPERLELETANQ